MEKAKAVTLFLLRVVAAYIFIQAGGMKLFNWFGGMPEGFQLSPLMWTAGFLEVFGGLAILLGIYTRPVAFILAGEMAVAYFIGHAIPMGHTWAPMLNDGHSTVLFCFIFLFLAAHGAGAWSLDRFWRSKE